ncbi:MAG: hypothetical protein A2251_00520 [Elusimicrobia bacterium RIFOXYA2_FULL_47_53]|nr:MAG: hypothetical protein A2386_00395 [Elusimicrobia bacterium RIFOXYB1_FULL_48_9]OGS15141.1 MAG: hypothetical protein A2251_00520 [Elusimicrobia bacterium RIFOXYA2_FULL_47_53]OGS29761.1 MAG: hypothetical protein A2323_01320 [Elusimicrobia bacterium RIFOXYB2_FULL_46_23]
MPVQAKLPEIKVSQAQMVQMPQFTFILPNSSIELSLHQQVSSSTFDIFSKYDILESFFNIGFDLRYNFDPFFAGTHFGDRINFEQNYGGKTYFQRVRNINPYYGYKLGGYTRIKVSAGLENTLTASVDKSVELDRGTNIIESVGIRYDTKDPLDPIPNGTLLAATFFSSFPNLVSLYDYTKCEVEIKNTYMPFLISYLETEFKFNFPLTTDKRPISDVYFAGGYELLRGYAYDEFYGDTLMYGKWNYHIPVVKKLKSSKIRGLLEIMTIDLTAEAAQIGNYRDFGNEYSIRASGSCGLGCDVVLFDHYNIKFDIFAGKAFEPRLPVMYFILTAYTYFSI